LKFDLRFEILRFEILEARSISIALSFCTISIGCEVSDVEVSDVDLISRLKRIITMEN